MKREEKISFLKAVLSVAKVDQDIDQTELSYYQQLSAELGLGSDEFSRVQTTVLSGNEPLEDSLDQIQERSTKLQLLYQMMLIACADGKVEEAEYDRIKEAAAYMKVEEEKTKEIADLVRESIELKVKKERILEQ